MRNHAKPNLLQTSLPTVLRSLALCAIVVFIMMCAPLSRAQTDILPTSTGTQTQARILVRSPARIEVRTEIYAPVREIPFRQGDSFNAGDLLVRFDCSRYEAETSAANASAHASDIEHQTKRKLFKYKAVGKDEVRLSAALSAKANAELKVQQVRISQCEFKAPFNGRVVETHVKKHEFPTSDAPLLTILDDNQLELQLIIPSIWLRWLKKGLTFRFEIDETGNNYRGLITRIGAEVDPVSQTIKVLGKFETTHGNVLAGMSGTAYFKVGS